MRARGPGPFFRGQLALRGCSAILPRGTVSFLPSFGRGKKLPDFSASSIPSIVRMLNSLATLAFLRRRVNAHRNLVDFLVPYISEEIRFVRCVTKEDTRLSVTIQKFDELEGNRGNWDSGRTAALDSRKRFQIVPRNGVSVAQRCTFGGISGNSRSLTRVCSRVGLAVTKVSLSTIVPAFAQLGPSRF